MKNELSLQQQEIKKFGVLKVPKVHYSYPNILQLLN